MAGPDQQQQQPDGNEVAQLFQNVGEGLVLINQYVSQAAPGAVELAAGILQQYEQLIGMVQEGREQGGGRQPMPQEAGAARTQQAF